MFTVCENVVGDIHQKKMLCFSSLCLVWTTFLFYVHMKNRKTPWHLWTTVTVFAIVNDPISTGTVPESNINREQYQFTISIITHPPYSRAISISIYNINHNISTVPESNINININQSSSASSSRKLLTGQALMDGWGCRGQTWINVNVHKFKYRIPKFQIPQFKMYTIQNVHNFKCRILKLKIPNVQMFQISMFTIQRADPNKCQRSKCSNVVMFSFLFRTKKTRKQLKTLKHTKTINWIAFSPFLHCSLELVEAALRELVRLRKVFFYIYKSVLRLSNREMVKSLDGL